MDCKTEEGASDDDMIPFATHEPFKSQKSKCVLACINEKMGYVRKYIICSLSPHSSTIEILTIFLIVTQNF